MSCHSKKVYHFCHTKQSHFSVILKRSLSCHTKWDNCILILKQHLSCDDKRATILFSDCSIFRHRFHIRTPFTWNVHAVAPIVTVISMLINSMTGNYLEMSYHFLTQESGIFSWLYQQVHFYVMLKKANPYFHVERRITFLSIDRKTFYLPTHNMLHT